MVGESQEQLVGAGAGGGSGSNKTPTLEEYGTNLTTQANEVNTVHRLVLLLCCDRQHSNVHDCFIALLQKQGICPQDCKAVTTTDLVL